MARLLCFHPASSCPIFVFGDVRAGRVQKGKNGGRSVFTRRSMRFSLQLRGTGMLGSCPFRENTVALLVPSAVDCDATELKRSCVKVSQASSEHGMKEKFERARKRNFETVVVANLQLLGILTALALGIDVRAASASKFGPLHSTWKIGNKCVESRQLNQVEVADEQSVRNGLKPDLELHRIGGMQSHGTAMATVNDGSDEEVLQDSDEETLRELEEWRANPYAVTVPLRIIALRGSVPPVWLKDFMRSQGKRVKLTAEFKGSLLSIFTEMKSALNTKRLTSRSVMAADLVTIGDSWLEKFVSGGLISPIENAERYAWYQRMGEKWQIFVRRDDHGLINPDGKVWGVPYRWGSVVIAYNHKQLQKCGISGIKDWPDLWKPELAGKISMIAATREVVGAVLKALGASYNVRDFETDVPGGRQAVKEKFLALQKQVLLFDNMQYLKTLGAGDVWVSVGWSEDIIPFAKRTSNITVIAPQSGTSLWADLWAIPAATTIESTGVGGRIRGPSPLILQWLDFCLQPARGITFQNNVIVGNSPLLMPASKVFLEPDQVGQGSNATEMNSKSDKESLEDEKLSILDLVEDTKPIPGQNLTGLLTADILSKCEFLEPLTDKTFNDYNWLLPKHERVPTFSVKVIESVRGIFLAVFGKRRIRV